MTPQEVFNRVWNHFVVNKAPLSFERRFDRIVMNPPFENGSDITHIRHALGFLAPGGRLVAICAAGPRQREAFESTASEWIDLPPGSFKEQGTNVNTAIVVFDDPN